MKRRLLLLLMAFAFLWCSPCDAFCLSDMQEDRLGSVTLRLIWENVPVSGGTAAICCLGQLEQTEDGNLIVVPTEDFALLSGVSYADLTPQLALALEQHLAGNMPSGEVREVDADGCVTFSALQAGLYLLMQPVSAEGFEKMKPFLVTVPLRQNKTLIFDIVAHPKVESKPGQTQPQAPAEPSLPQTGQLRWPIPLLGSLGSCLLVTGGILCLRRKRDDNET